MVVFKPQFRPMYMGYNSIASNESLVDKINTFYYDCFKDTSLKDLAYDFVTTIKNDVKKVTTDIVEGKKIYASVGVGVGLGILGNFISAYITDQLGGDHTIIERVSLIAEIIFHSIGYAGTFIMMSKKEGMSRKDIAKDLAKTTIVVAPIATIPYPGVRNPLADVYMDKGITPEMAVVLSQVTLSPFYGRVVKLAVKYFGYKAEEFLEKIPYFRKEEPEVVLIGNEHSEFHIVGDSNYLNDIVEQESKAI